MAENRTAMKKFAVNKIFEFFCKKVPFPKEEDTPTYIIIYFHKSSCSFRQNIAKVFYPLTIIGKLQAVCWGISQKFYKKIAENFSRQQHIKRKSDIIQTSFYFFGYFVKSFLTHRSHVQYVI